MRKLKIGYVGCGFMAQKVHMPNIQALENCELVAAAEVRSELGKKVQKKFGIPKLHPDHRALAADPDVEAIAISGHFAGQGELAIDVVRAGKDVFMEKPMAVSVDQSNRILEAERQSGKRIMVGYMKRYDAGNVVVKEMMDRFRKSGELGAVSYARNHGFCGDWTAGLGYDHETSDEKPPQAPVNRPDWMPEKFYGGYIGYLQQYTHNINLLRWLLDAGDDVKVKTVDLDREHGMSGVVIMEMNGVRAIVESGQVAHHAWDEHTQVYFDKGWVRTEAPPLLLRNAPASVEVYRGDDGHEKKEIFPKDGWTWSYKEEMRHFADCVMSGEPFRSPASDAAVDVRVIEDIYRKFVEGLN